MKKKRDQKNETETVGDRNTRIANNNEILLCQQMAKVPNGKETSPKISTG